MLKFQKSISPETITSTYTYKYLRRRKMTSGSKNGSIQHHWLLDLGLQGPNIENEEQQQRKFISYISELRLLSIQ